MARHFPPAAYTSAALAIIFATLSVWQIVRLAEGQRAASVAWATARNAAENALAELSADASINALPRMNEDERGKTAFLRESLVLIGRRLEEQLVEEKGKIVTTRAIEEQAVKNAEETLGTAEHTYRTRAKNRDDDIEKEKARNKAHASLWRVKYDPNRTPPWHPGDEVFVMVPWKGREVDLPDPLEDVVWASNSVGIGGNYPARRAAWEAGVTFCNKANQLEGAVREARAAVDKATAGIERARANAEQLLNGMQERVAVLAANRKRCEEAITSLAMSGSVTAVRSAMLYLDVPALLASVAACFVALTRLALVANWFRGRRILRPTAVPAGTNLGLSR